MLREERRGLTIYLVPSLVTDNNKHAPSALGHPILYQQPDAIIYFFPIISHRGYSSVHLKHDALKNQ